MIRLGNPRGMEVCDDGHTLRLDLPTTVTDTGGLQVGVPMHIAVPRRIGERGVVCRVVHELVADYLPEVSGSRSLKKNLLVVITQCIDSKVRFFVGVRRRSISQQ